MVGSVLLSIFTLSAVAAPPSISAECKEFGRLIRSAALFKHSVPFRDHPSDDEGAVYDIVFPGLGPSKLNLTLCGRGRDSSCVVEVESPVGHFEEPLPSSIRVVSIREQIFIVTGVMSDRKERLIRFLPDIGVYRVRPDIIEKICSRV